MSELELSIFVWLAGLVIGMGAVTVIEALGFLGQRSGYWTEATIRTHKVTKPLIWLGLGLATVGGVWTYRQIGISMYTSLHLGLLVLMLLNGSFLTFWISPRLLERERRGQSQALLPKSWKTAITFSFLISVATWWSALLIFVKVIVNYG